MAKPDYKAISEEMAQSLNMALTKLQTNKEWTGNLINTKTKEVYSWEEYFARLIEKLPNMKVDRRYIEAKYLPAKERRKRYYELSQETPEQRKAAIDKQEADNSKEG